MQTLSKCHNTYREPCKIVQSFLFFNYFDFVKNVLSLGAFVIDLEGLKKIS